MSMKYAVIGGAGFIGSHLVRELLHLKHSITVIDSLAKGKKENLKDILNVIEFLDVDIRDNSSLGKSLKFFDGVYHLAWQESFSKQKEYFQVNVEGTENILKLALKHGFKVIYASSLSVYGNPKRNPVSEDHEKNPITPYGITKLRTEHLLEKYAKLGVESIGLRYFNVYGKRKLGPNNGVIPDFLENIAKNEPLVIYGSGSQIRDFIFIEDVIKATCLAMESKMKSGFINIGSGIGTSISDLADLMIRLSRKDLTTVYTNSQHLDEFDIWADISKAQNSLGWFPETSLEKGLQKISSMMKSR